MSLISMVLIIIVVGVLLWLINTFVPMAASIKAILNILVVIILILWILSSMGIIGPLNLKI